MVHLGERKINDKNYDIKCFFISSHCWSNINNFYFSEGSIIQKLSSISDLEFFAAYPIWTNTNNFD